MSLTHEMIKENVFNWLDALIVGAKAMSTVMQCGTDDWRSEASVYNGDDCIVDGIITVHIHNIEQVAKAVEIDIQHHDFTPANEYYAYFKGENFFIYNGVKFSGMIYGNFSDEEKSAKIEERKRYEENAGKQSSNSGASEEVSVDNE